MSDDSETEGKSSGRKEKIAIIAVAAAVVLAITTVSTLESQIVDRNEVLNMSATIEPQQETNNTTVGINTGQKLHYGNITYDTNVTKFIQISADRKSFLDVEATGNISDHIQFQDRYYFEGNETLEVKIGSKEPGYYEGKLKLHFQVPETRWASKWISLKYRYS